MNSSIAHTFAIITIPQIAMPKKPAEPPASINASLNIEVCWLRLGIINEAVAVKPTIINSGAEIIPLFTAASPIIRPPTIEIALPTADGDECLLHASTPESHNNKNFQKTTGMGLLVQKQTD